MDFQVVRVPLLDRFAEPFIPHTHRIRLVCCGPAQLKQFPLLLGRQAQLASQRRHRRGGRNAAAVLEGLLDGRARPSRPGGELNFG